MSDALGRILVVDDEAPMREILTEYFAARGYAVEVASNGNDALAAIKRDQPDLVLLDIRMPGIDGVETLRRIRARGDQVPVIMVTANEDVELARAALKLGAFDYVAKPFDFSYLDLTVAAGLGRGGSPGPGDPPLETTGDPWKRLTLAIFRATRDMEAGARESTGARLEGAALAAAREAAVGRPAGAAVHLGEIHFLLTIAGDLGDLPGSDRSHIEAALEAARRALPTPS